MKAALILPFVAFAVQVLAQVPPACLLHAVNTQDEPSDLSAVCGGEALHVQEAIASLCDSNQSVAQAAFISTCSAAGSSVAPYTATSTSSTSHTGSATTSHTSGTGPASQTAASSTNTAGGASATGNAATDAKQVGSFAAAVIAIAGVVAAL